MVVTFGDFDVVSLSAEGRALGIGVDVVAFHFKLKQATTVPTNCGGEATWNLQETRRSLHTCSALITPLLAFATFKVVYSKNNTHVVAYRTMRYPQDCKFPAGRVGDEELKTTRKEQYERRLAFIDLYYRSYEPDSTCSANTVRP